MHAITRTEFTVCARYTQLGVTYAIATQDILHGGIWHDAAIANDPALTSEWASSALRGGSLRITIASRDDLLPGGVAAYLAVRDNPVDGLEVEVEVITTVTWADGSSQQFAEAQTLTCVRRERAPGTVTLELTDIEDEKLNTLYPPETYTTDEFPDLSPLDEGRAMPSVVGIAEKVPLGRISGVGPWEYIVAKQCVPGAALGVFPQAVYRGKSPADARVAIPDNVSSFGSYMAVQYNNEQRDFSGAEYRIFADVSSATYTAPQVIRQLLLDAGCSVDSTSFTACETWAATEGLLVDCDFGAWGQRTTRAIIEDLLYVCRATLTRLADGSYGIVYDGPATTWAEYDEDAGDPIEITGLTEASQPAKVGIRYRPSPRDPANALQFTILRDVPGGTQGEERPRECRYVRRHDVADKTAYYYAQRAAHSARLRCKVYRTVHALGDTLRINSAAFGLSASEWRVRKVRHIPGGCELECERYSAALVTYVAGTLPGDPGADYTPDYSNTPPAAPTSLRITAGDTHMAGDGAVTASVTVDTMPPAVNWEKVMFSAVHDVTGEIPALLRGDPVSGGREGVVITGLRPGETYKLLAWAENGFGVQGLVQGTFDATAIGGSMLATTFTAPGYAVVPANVTGLAATQGMGRLVNVSWNAVTTANLREYVLERRIGSGAYAEVWRGQARSYIDRNVSYGSAYQYRIRARDLWGNVSAFYATSTALTLTQGTIVGGSSGNDIGGTTVATSNRTSASTASTTVTALLGGLHFSYSIAHGLTRVPLVTVSANDSYFAADVRTVNSTSVTGKIRYEITSAKLAPNQYTDYDSGSGTHRHALAQLPVNIDGVIFNHTGLVTVTATFW